MNWTKALIAGLVILVGLMISGIITGLIGGLVLGFLPDMGFFTTILILGIQAMTYGTVIIWLLAKFAK